MRIGIATLDKSISVNISPTFGVPVQLIGGTASNLNCTTTNGGSANPTQTIGVVAVKSLGVIAINCTRNATPDPPNANVTATYDSSELTLNIAGIEAPLQMGLPASELVGRVEKQVYESKIAQLESRLRPFTSPLGTRMSDGAKCVAAFDSLPAPRFQGLLNNSGYWLSFDKAQRTFRAAGANGASDQATGTLTSERQGSILNKSFGIYGSTIEYSDTGALSTAGKVVGQLFCPPGSN